MKIGFLITYFHPFEGGAENNCFYLARELAKYHEVHVFTSDRKGRNILRVKEEVVEGIRIHRSKTWMRYKYYVTLNPGLLVNILRYKLDILHVHSLGFLWHDIIVLLKKIFSKNTKIINTPHGPFMALNNYKRIEKFYKFFVRSLEKIINKVYDGVIEVNNSQHAWFIKSGFKKNKIFFVPNGIPHDAFKDIAISRELRYKFGDKLIMSYLGRVQKYKGLSQVIRILPSFPKIVFVIIGEDYGERAKLEKIAKELKVNKRVFFVGKVTDEAKFALLDISKIFIFPSEWEAFGIAILEAMARGNVIISTKTEGGKYLVGKENGFLFDFGDVEGLKNILSKVLQNKRQMDYFIKNNMNKAKNFMWEDITKKLNTVYLTISGYKNYDKSQKNKS